jgi:hypothetical protein
LFNYLLLKAESLRASFRKLPFRSDGGLVPDEIAMQTKTEPAEKPAELEARILEILRVASQLQRGDLRRDALAEVTRLRRRAIELHRCKAAELGAARISQRGNDHLRRRWGSEGTGQIPQSASDGQEPPA